jgi:hypothetical protein
MGAEEAFRMLAKWRESRAVIRVAMSRGGMGGREEYATLKEVLPHSQKALVSLQDESGEAVDVTVSLEGAEWEGLGEGALAATFPNGNRYVFRESVKTR